MKKLLISALFLIQCHFTGKTQETKSFIFPDLPYSYEALDPFVDKMTMEIHYSRHHRSYYNNFIKALEENKMEGVTLNEIFSQVSTYPSVIRNQGGGYYNHCLFWEIMSPDGGGSPSGRILEDIVNTFGSFEQFKIDFEKAAITLFGSGWVWLAVDPDGKLFIIQSPNQDNPLMDVSSKRGVPMLGIDVWEHAYYLRYQNKRAEYVTNFWKVVNWKKVEEIYIDALK